MSDDGTRATGPLGEVGPELYRRNAFRVTGLTIDATARDLRKQGERLRIMERVEMSSPAGSTILPLDEPPDATAVREAVRRLQDPTRRVVDEFFWFWPSTEPDQAMIALRHGDVDEATRLWEHGSTAADLHNRAVLAHALALDRDGIDAEGRRLWREAFEHWRTVFAERECWRIMTARIQKMNDPRVRPDIVAELREGLPSALLSINAQLAVHAFRNDRRAETDGHVVLLRESGFLRETIDDARRRAAESDAAQVRALCDTARQTARADPPHADEAARRLLDQSAPLLDLLTAVLPQSHPTLLGARDEVARLILGCTVPFAKATDDWRTTSELLNRALPIAGTDSTRAKINENISIVADNAYYGTCRFCQERPADDDSVYEQKMYGDVARTVVSQSYNSRRIRTTWNARTIKVPRCAGCKATHARRKKNLNWGCAGQFLLIALAIVMFVLGIVLGGIGFLVLTVAAFIAWTVIEEIPGKQRKTLREFQPIKQRIEAGWKFGEKPPNPS